MERDCIKQLQYDLKNKLILNMKQTVITLFIILNKT